MNAMKKFFLLTLLSVFFLSAFSQIQSGPEILYRINIDRSANPNEPVGELEPYIISGEDIQFFNHWIFWWWPFFRTVTTEVGPGWVTVTCEGKGWKPCWLNLKVLWSNVLRDVQTIEPEVAEATYEDLIKESEELVSNGIYKGSLSKKLAIPGDRINLVIFQMNWNYNPRNIYDGKAEIIISKTNTLGF